MSYSNFSLEKLKAQFDLTIRQERELYSDVEGIGVSHLLKETLKENYPLAIAIHTEKARSEMIVAPVLIEIRRQLNHKVSLFSGVEFNVDRKRDLKGVCDFLFCLSPEQLLINAPVLTIVEAKNDNIKAGIPQCIAEMEAARIFNLQKENNIPVIYGVVTTGTSWQFLRLSNQVAEIDLIDYHINDLEKIVGIIVSFFPSLKVES